MNTYLVQVYGNSGSAVEVTANSFARAAEKYVEDETAWTDKRFHIQVTLGAVSKHFDVEVETVREISVSQRRHPTQPRGEA